MQPTKDGIKGHQEPSSKALVNVFLSSTSRSSCSDMGTVFCNSHSREREASVSNDNMCWSTKRTISQVGLAGAVVDRAGPLINVVMSVP